MVPEEQKRNPPPLGSKTWKKEELLYLEEQWGNVSISSIASRLKRTENAVIVKARRLELGPALMSGDYVTFNQLVIALTGHSSNSYQMKSWIKNRDFPVHTKRVLKNTFKIVYLDEFWKWAEKNRSFIDFSRMEPFSLGAEPEWVAEQRRKDFYSCRLQRKDPWTPDEDNKLKYLLSLQRYSWQEISEKLHRSTGAIQRRCCDLKIKDRPVKADTHSKESTWTDEDLKILADGIRSGESYMLIGSKLKRSEKAVRGKVYYDYLTESADKVRSMLQDKEWGYGAPDPTVRQGLKLSRSRADVRKNLSALAGLLKLRRNELGYEPYWQRHMCLNWDDFEGCLANCTDCDSCIEFRRIKPQYCARCGATFFERKENTFCENCRKARKKQAQRKWCALNNKGRG